MTNGIVYNSFGDNRPAAWCLVMTISTGGIFNVGDCVQLAYSVQEATKHSRFHKSNGGTITPWVLY